MECCNATAAYIAKAHAGVQKLYGTRARVSVCSSVHAEEYDGARYGRAQQMHQRWFMIFYEHTHTHTLHTCFARGFSVSLRRSNASRCKWHSTSFISSGSQKCIGTPISHRYSVRNNSYARCIRTPANCASRAHTHGHRHTDMQRSAAPKMRHL